MRQILLRHVYLVQLTLFIISAGVLTYFAQNERWWPQFWLALATSSLLFLANAHATSEEFRSKSERLIRSQNELATRFGDAGISRFFNMQDTTQQAQRNGYTQEILNRGSRFSLMTLTAASYVDPAVGRHWDVLKRKLDTGSALRLVVLDPFGAEKAIRNELNGTRETPDSKLRFEHLARLYQAYERVDVRVSSWNLYGAVFLAEDEMTYDPYHLGKVATRIENRFLCMAIERLRDENGQPLPGSYFAILESHFEAVWLRSTSLPDFVSTHRRETREYTGSQTFREVTRLLGLG